MYMVHRKLFRTK